MKMTKKEIEKYKKETYPFYNKCIEEQGYCCPYCGSENINDWEKIKKL